MVQLLSNRHTVFIFIKDVTVIIYELTEIALSYFGLDSGSLDHLFLRLEPVHVWLQLDFDI